MADINYDKFNVKLLSALSYIGPLFVVGRFSLEYGNKSVKFHVKQGGMLCVFMITLYSIFAILMFALSSVPTFAEIIGYLSFVGITVLWIILIIMGISSVIKDQERELPLVGITEKVTKKLF